MKTIILTLILFSGQASAWYGPGWGPGWGGYGYGGYPYGMMGAMGYGWGIQAPSFNYSTVIQQSPPIIINEQAPSPPQVIYREREVCNDECERLRGYFRKH